MEQQLSQSTSQPAHCAVLTPCSAVTVPDTRCCCCNRVAQQASTLAARVAGGADPHAPQQLINLLRALTRCLSLLRQRVHDDLLAQALGVSLWSCAQVQLPHSRQTPG